MSAIYERIVAEDLDIGTGTVQRHLPGGGTATGSQCHIGTFADPGVALAAIGAAAAHPGQQRVISDSDTTTPGAVPVGGGANRALLFSNGVSWKVVMA